MGGVTDLGHSPLEKHVLFVSFPNIDDYDGEHQRDEVEEGDVGEEHCDVDGGVPVQFEITFRCLTNYWR